jgi:hypothetical protein
VARKAECLTDGYEPLPSILRQHITIKELSFPQSKRKEELTLPSSLQLSDTFLTFGKIDEGTSTLTRPSTVTSLTDIVMLINAPVLTAPTTEQLSPGPSCLQSIAWFLC